MTCESINLLTVSQGAGKTFKFTLTDSNCRPVDLQNVTLLDFMVKISVDDLDDQSIIHKQIDLGDPRHDLEYGIIYFDLTEVDTRFLQYQRYVWDFRGERSSGTSPFHFPAPPGDLEVLPVVNRNVTPPALVDDFVATAGDTEITLNWTNPTDTDLAEVLVRRKLGGYPEEHTDGDLVFRITTPVPGAVETDIDSGLTNDTEYYYAVFSRDQVLNWQDTVTEFYNADKAIPVAP